MKKPTKWQLIKQLREEILQKYPHLKYERMFWAESYPHLLFTTLNDDYIEISEAIASRCTDILLETGHYILAGVYPEDELVS
ncbi:hypothetical protein FJZ31_09020 [Candidatus Poribacteria bacterium]|nr:hypothetical protein [Candidatus Poribacteria bacterium]